MVLNKTPHSEVLKNRLRYTIDEIELSCWISLVNSPYIDEGIKRDLDSRYFINYPSPQVIFWSRDSGITNAVFRFFISLSCCIILSFILDCKFMCCNQNNDII